MTTNAELTPFQASPSAKNLAQWLAFIRLFCYVRTPACIYSKIETPYSHRTYRTTKTIPAPTYISNILCDIINEHTAREAVSLQAEKDLLYSEVRMDISISSTYKPRGMEPYGISRYSLVRLGEELVATGVAHVSCSAELMRYELVKAVTVLGRGAEAPGPLWWEELVWLEKHGGQWLWGTLLDMEAV